MLCVYVLYIFVIFGVIDSGFCFFLDGGNLINIYISIVYCLFFLKVCISLFVFGRIGGKVIGLDY